MGAQLAPARHVFHAFRASAELRRTVDVSLAQVDARVGSGDFAAPATESLARVDAGEFGPGSKPVVALRAGERRYIFKVQEAPLAAAEEAASALRRLGNRPCIPAVALDLEVEGFGTTRGTLKPFVEWESEAELAADTTSWTVLQRSVLLLEHAWEWFLDNLDTNTTQYKLFGELGVPLNIDWDRAFATGGTSPMSRFAKHRAVLPNARNFLYADYVAGRIELPFDLLFREARRIANLPRAEVRRILEKYAAASFATTSERNAFVLRLLDRQRNISSETRAFVHHLFRERQLYQQPSSVGSRIRATGASLWHDWQLFLNDAFHGPVGATALKLLSLARGRRAQQQSSS
jgi:hypothetical protein